MKNIFSRAAAIGLSSILLTSAALLPTAALEPHGNSVKVRNWLTNDPEYSFSEAYKTSVWYENFDALELTANTRNNILRVALSQLGYHEGDSADDFDGMNTSGSSNYIEYARLLVPNYNDNHYEWCACFVNWCLNQARVDYAYGEIGCWKWVEWLKANDMFQDSFAYSGTYLPQPADMIFFNWKETNTTSGHIGYVLYVTDTTIYTIEGNSNNEVGIRSYDLYDPCVIGFGTPAYPDGGEETIDFSCANGMPYGQYILNTSQVKLTSAAGGGKRLAVLPVGTTVTYLDEAGEYTRVSVDDKVGYVRTSTLQLLTPAQSAEFIADNKTTTIPCTHGVLSQAMPAVPNKAGYTGVWSDPVMNGMTLTFEAAYSIVPYTVTFVADETVVAELPFTVEERDITPPAVPEKEGYTGVWESYELGTADLTVKAVYTAITEPETETESEPQTSAATDAETPPATETTPDAPDDGKLGCTASTGLSAVLVAALGSLLVMLRQVLRRKRA